MLDVRSLIGRSREGQVTISILSGHWSRSRGGRQGSSKDYITWNRKFLKAVIVGQ